MLWKEFDFWICGGEATFCFDYSYPERGANKCVYSLQKVFWGVVKKMIANGHTLDSAIDVYSWGKSNSNIIKELKRTRKGVLIDCMYAD